jgi:hypothetical protein
VGVSRALRFARFFLQIKLDKNTLTDYIYSGYLVVFNGKGANDV